MSFYCTCGFEKSLQQQSQVSTHMSQCSEFQNDSIIYQNLDKNMLTNMPIDQLLVFYADLNGWLEKINEKITDSEGLLETRTVRQEGSSSNQDINCQKRFSDPVTVKDTQEQEVIDVEESEVEDLDLLPLQTKFPQKRPDYSLTNVNAHNTCEICGTRKLVATNTCGHGLCQQCFVNMYRQNDDLKCSQINCQEPFDRNFILELCFDSSRLECSICEKYFPSRCAVKKHSYVHTKAQKKFVCDNCNQSYFNYEELQEHRGRKHGSRSNDQFRRQQFAYRMKQTPDYTYSRDRYDYSYLRDRIDYDLDRDRIDYGLGRDRDDRFITLSEESQLEQFEPPLQRRFNNPRMIDQSLPTLIEDD